MSNIIRCVSDSGGADAYVYKDLGALRNELYVTFDVYISQALVDASVVDGYVGDICHLTENFVNVSPDPKGVLVNLVNPAIPNWCYQDSINSNITPAVIDTWQTVSIHYLKNATNGPAVQIDGVDYGAVAAETPVDQVDGAVIGLYGPSANTQPLYLRNIKFGSTAYGSSDLFSEAGGSLAGFTSTSGAVSVVSDSAIVGVHGISVAFDDAALVVNPSWTRLDTETDVAVQRYTIRRGRADERSKTGTGTATISGIDLNGVLDPTNSTGPFYTLLDPVKQVSIYLQNPVTGGWSSIFRGFVSDWNYDLDVTENFTRFDIECVDALDIFADAEVIPDVAGNTVPSESTGDVYYDPQATVDDRIFAALADAALSVGVTEWPAGLMNIFSGNVAVQGTVYSSQTPLLQVLDDAADAEFPGVANRYVSKTGIFSFKGRLARFNPTDPTYGITTWKAGDEAAFVGDSSTAVISGLKFTRGKTNLINAAIATPTGIADADIAGQFDSDAVSIAAFGARSISFPNLITQQGNETGTPDALDETKKFASYYVDNFKDPRNRVSQIVFRPQATSGARGAAVWALMCGVEISDRISLTTTHPGGGGFNEDFYVEGITYEVVPMTASHPEVTLTLDLSPTAYFTTDPFS